MDNNALNHNSLLKQIHEGMTVIDSDNNTIGEVKFVQFGDDNAQTTVTEAATPSGTVTDENMMDSLLKNMFAVREDIPEEVRRRFMRYGYIRIDRSIFKADRYAVADQIASVSDESVYLTTSAGGLLENR